MRFLKQSTATTLLLGPFLDSTDGVTAETALTISQADVLLWKEGGTTLAQKNEATSCTHRSAGYYTCPVNATDTNTLGTLVVTVAESGAIPVRQDYTVVAANVYDSLFGAGTDKLEVDIVQAGGDAQAGTNFARGLRAQISGVSDNTAFTATTTIFESDTVTEATADHYIGCVIAFTSGALLGQRTVVTDYELNGGRGRFTVVALTEAVPDNSEFTIY
jgi:hypothetical protein